MELNLNNRTLFAHDCLDVLSDRSIFPDDCIDLIYLDPPFNSKSQYNLPFPKEYKNKQDLKPVMAFTDTWSWRGADYLKTLESGSIEDLKIAELIKVARRIRNEKFTSCDSMGAYLVNMAVRLKEMRRILKQTGSIYLHCDPTASHYLKLILDAVFGKDNFLNEIVWGYRTGGVSKKKWARKHDVIFIMPMYL